MQSAGLAQQENIVDFFVPERLDYLRVVLNATGQCFYAVDTEGYTTLCNQAFLQAMGFAHESEVVGKKLHSIIHHSHPDGCPYAVEDCPIYRCASAGVAAHVEDELFFTRNGTAIPVTYDAYPIVIRGQLEGAICNFRDTTAERAEKKRLEESEFRFRSLFDYLEVGFCTLELKFDAQGKPIDYRHLDANPAFFLQTGMADNVLGEWVSDIIPGHEQHWYDVYGEVAKTGNSRHFEYEARGLKRWFDVYAYRPPGMAVNQIQVLFTDISIRKKIEERDDMLAAELQHRVKNTMAIIQAIIRQTLRSEPNINLAQKTIDQRLVALGRAQDMLSSGGWVSSDLRSIIEGSVIAHTDTPERFKLSGPAVQIDSQAAMSFALMLHELSTNATKYGALSVPGGIVEITWAIDQTAKSNEGAISFTLDWIEVGGPMVTPPANRGFGSKLIESSLSSAIDGGAVIDFLPSGVKCRVNGLLRVPS